QVAYGPAYEVRVGVGFAGGPQGGRRRQQQVGVVRCQSGQVAADDGGEDVRDGRRPGQLAVSPQGGRGQAGGPGDQRGGVVVRLGDESGPHGRVDGAVGRVVQRGRGVGGGERWEGQGGEPGQFGDGGEVAGHGQEHHGPARGRVDACGGLPEGGARGRVPQVRVVHAQQVGDAAGRLAEGGEQGLAGDRKSV